jgi:hypothetical protein
MTMRVQVRGNHYVLLGHNGDELLTSKEYADDPGALRSARHFYDNLMSGDIELETAEVTKTGTGKSSVQKWTRVETLAEPGDLEAESAETPRRGGAINVPEPGKALHANSPYAQ